MIEQIQMHVNLLKLLDYQLKELLKMHTDTYVTLNTFIYIHNINNINNSIQTELKNIEILEKTKIEAVQILNENNKNIYNSDDEDENKELLINDVDNESENEIISMETQKNIQDSENITDSLIEKPFNTQSCFARKYTCMPIICNISTREDRERRIREELEEVVTSKVEKFRKKKVKLVDKTKTKTKIKYKNCTIM